MTTTEAMEEVETGGPGFRSDLAILGFFAVCSMALTWPLVVTLNAPTGLRGDYFNNLWNFWWMARSIGRLESPYFTDLLYYPEGLSLMRHTLSPINAVLGALFSTFMGLHAAFNVLVLLKLTASAWTMYVFARYVTGSRGGAVLAGLVYAFNPFHFSYICQINVFTLEFVPLALYYGLRVQREGGLRTGLFAVLSIGAIAATSSYYVVYTYIVLGMMVLCGRWVAPDVPWRLGARRVILLGAAGAVMVCLVSLPLLIGTWQARNSTFVHPAVIFQRRRANDLFGYGWVGGPERLTVSWPTMLGYSTLAFLVLGWREVKRHRFWLLVGGVFLVLSLGKTLHVNRTEWGLPLPYQLLVELPVLKMLRKPDRCFMIVQLVVALVSAAAWRGVVPRLRGGWKRWGWWGLATLIMVELTGVPFARFDYRPPKYMSALAEQDDVDSVLQLPPMDLDVLNARYVYYQTVHGKKDPLGYSTAFATDERHNEQMEVLVNGYLGWIERIHKVLPLWVRENDVDLVIHHKTMPQERPARQSIDDKVLWAPFFFVRRDLIGIRQTGQYLDQRLTDRHVAGVRVQMFSEFGQPIYEDEDLIVFRVEK